MEAGQLISLARELPSKGDVEAAIKRNDPALATPLSETLKPTGTCKQDEYDQFLKEKESACSNMLGCSGNIGLVEAYSRAIKQMVCSTKREEMENKCFDGGNKSHRQYRQERWRAVANCLGFIP